MARRSKAEEEAERFRKAIRRLRSFGEIYWDWEADWLDSEARRPTDYVPSEKERVILNQISAAAQTFDGYDGVSVPGLIKLAYRFRADLSFENERFVERLHEEMPRRLALKPLVQLVNIVRLTEVLGRDALVEEAFAATRRRDEEMHEVSEFVPYETFRRAG